MANTNRNTVLLPNSFEVNCSSLRIGWLEFTPERPVVFSKIGIFVQFTGKGPEAASFKLNLHFVELAKSFVYANKTESEFLICLYMQKACGHYIKGLIKNEVEDFADNRACVNTRRLVFMLSSDNLGIKNKILTSFKTVRLMTEIERNILLTQFQQHDALCDEGLEWRSSDEDDDEAAVEEYSSNDEDDFNDEIEDTDNDDVVVVEDEEDINQDDIVIMDLCNDNDEVQAVEEVFELDEAEEAEGAIAAEEANAADDADVVVLEDDQALAADYGKRRKRD